ncbi:Hypothetical protein GSB_151206 [Giardia duodenalis]|uniref:TPR repeat family protein n=2 Tax=Giardia intestinalis TaxID=5741 RepID=C6LYZ5_GIAIB|nr:Hypothetical protein GL50581_4024 [Giardia intestinalis ATCC 50581]ESU44223.1 Hypothetical protein GSB_151206 [Giardia intestinalis]
MASDMHRLDTILRRAVLSYQKGGYSEALTAYIKLQDLVTMRHNQQAPCRMFREKAYLRVFKAVLYSSMGACLVSMHKNPEAYELLECSLKMCPTPLASQRMVLLLIRMNRLHDIQKVLDVLLKPSIIHQDAPRGEHEHPTILAASDALVLQAAIQCHSGSNIDCLNTLSLSIVMLLRSFSKAEHIIAGDELPDLPTPELLQGTKKLQCRLVFLAVCNILQTFSHRGVTLPYRCDYNIEELIVRLCNSKVKGLCLNTIFDPSSVSHEAHDAFLKYGGEGSLPGSGLQSLDSLYAFFQTLFSSCYDSSYLPLTLLPFFDDRIFSSETWSVAASRNVIYSRLKGQTTVVQQSQLLEVMDDTDLALLILKKYDIKPLSYLFTLPDHLLSLITDASVSSKPINSQSSNSINVTFFTHKDSTTIAKIMRAKENQTVRVFRLAEECAEEHSIHPVSPKEPFKESADPLRESLQSKIMSYLQLSPSKNRHLLARSNSNSSHSNSKDADIASKMILQDLQVSVAPLVINKPTCSALATTNVAENSRSRSAHLYERSTAATRASTKAAERVHLVAALRPTGCESHKPSYVKLEPFTSRRVSSSKIQSRTQKLASVHPSRTVSSLSSYSVLHRSEMNVPNVCLSTLKQLLLKKKVGAATASSNQQALLCTNLPIFQKIESVRPLVVKASKQSTHSVTPLADLHSPGPPLLPDIEQYSESLSIHDHSSMFRKAPILQHPMRDCVSCPATRSKDRTRHLSNKDKEQFQKMYDAALSANAVDSLSFRTPYYNELIHAINSGDHEEILLNYSMGHRDAGISDFDFVDKEQLNCYKRTNRSQSLEQSISTQNRLLQSARSVFNAYSYIQANISETKASLNKLALAMRPKDNEKQSLMKKKSSQHRPTTERTSLDRQDHLKNTIGNIAVSPSEMTDHVCWNNDTDERPGLAPILLPDLKTVVSKEPVRFADYFLNQIDLELVHRDPHERRTLLLRCKEDARQFAGSELLHSKAVSRRRTDVLPATEAACSTLHHRMNVVYVPDYHSIDQDNSLGSTESELLSTCHPPRVLPDLLKSVVLDLTSVKHLGSSSSSIHTASSNASSTALGSVRTTGDCSPDVHLQSRTSSRSKGHGGDTIHLFSGSRLYKRNSSRYKAFADILLNSTIKPHVQRKRQELSVIHIHASTPTQQNSQIRLSRIPKEPRRPRKLNIPDVIHRASPASVEIKILRLRTAAFIFKVPL